MKIIDRDEIEANIANAIDREQKALIATLNKKIIEMSHTFGSTREIRVDIAPGMNANSVIDPFRHLNVEELHQGIYRISW